MMTHVTSLEEFVITNLDHCILTRVSFQKTKIVERPFTLYTATNRTVLYNKQSCHAWNTEKVSLAVTSNYEWEIKEWDAAKEEYVFKWENIPAQIQLCDWFIGCTPRMNSALIPILLKTILYRVQKQGI